MPENIKRYLGDIGSSRVKDINDLQQQKDNRINELSMVT